MKKFINARAQNLCPELSPLGTPIIEALGAPDNLLLPNFSKMDKHYMQRSDFRKSELQPPLPRDPPPAHYNPNLQVKQEILDPEYETNHLTQLQENHDEGHANQSNDHSSELCRDFIRGTCKREGTCRYAHKYDLSKLEGIYTFCRKFQNSVCTFTNCKYVHATVFEEQHFYRTGVLPAHALHHKMNNNMLQPPPPPPPEGNDFVLKRILIMLSLSNFPLVMPMLAKYSLLSGMTIVQQVGVVNTVTVKLLY